MKAFPDAEPSSDDKQKIRHTWNKHIAGLKKYFFLCGYIGISVYSMLILGDSSIFIEKNSVWAEYMFGIRLVGHRVFPRMHSTYLLYNAKVCSLKGFKKHASTYLSK